jgi:hypothetical protein
MRRDALEGADARAPVDLAQELVGGDVPAAGGGGNEAAGEDRGGAVCGDDSLVGQLQNGRVALRVGARRPEAAEVRFVPDLHRPHVRVARDRGADEPLPPAVVLGPRRICARLRSAPRVGIAGPARRVVEEHHRLGRVPLHGAVGVVRLSPSVAAPASLDIRPLDMEPVRRERVPHDRGGLLHLPARPVGAEAAAPPAPVLIEAPRHGGPCGVPGSGQVGRRRGRGSEQDRQGDRQDQRQPPSLGPRCRGCASPHPLSATP